MQKTVSPFKRFWLFIKGGTQDPFNPDIFHNIALVAFLAWIGLGADGLSSACYGPAEAFLALGRYTHLAFYIAIITAITVFIIALSYNQVVALFPSGGGGYKVATQLLGSYAGLISGAALIVDYILTIAISVASGVDALFSLLPSHLLHYHVFTELAVIGIMIVLNLRGMKETIMVLLPIFLGFVIVHVLLIIYGIVIHHKGLPLITQTSIKQTHELAATVGWGSVIALLLHSYSLGSGSYTGLEAVSNNVNRLAEPKVRTGKFTMFYMAVSLSFTASGIILLYLLWDIHPVSGQTLNAVVFGKILGDSALGHALLILTLFLEAGILLIAGNAGFFAGPVVLANMSVDQWWPKRFRLLSNRLVIENGVIFFGVAAAVIIVLSRGAVSWLIVLYSINVFITFSITLFGLCVYWAKQRKLASKYWWWRLCFSFLGFLITSSILVTTLFSKFVEGGVIAMLITGIVVLTCVLVRRHYDDVKKRLNTVSKLLAPPLKTSSMRAPLLEPHEPTAVFFVGDEISLGMHTFLWSKRLFPNHFKNFIFVSVGAVDTESFAAQQTLSLMKVRVEKTLRYFVNYCHAQGLAARSYAAYGPEIIEHLSGLTEQISQEFPHAIFFATRLILDRDNWLTRMLHNETAITLQRNLHAMGKQLIILPMKV